MRAAPGTATAADGVLREPAAMAYTAHQLPQPHGVMAEPTPRPTTNGEAPRTDTRFRIGGAELDTRTRQLSFAGQTVDVQPKVFDLLEYLVRQRDRVFSKDELLDEIWPAVVVSDASLSQTIKRTRDVFREAGFADDIIRTVPRKGYQFGHPVEVAERDTRIDPAAPPGGVSLHDSGGTSHGERHSGNTRSHKPHATATTCRLRRSGFFYHQGLLWLALPLLITQYW